MTAPAVAALALAPLIAWRIVRTALAYRGDTSPATRDLALRHFSQDDIDRGKTCSTPYYLPNTIGYVIEAAFLWALVFLGFARLIERFALSLSSNVIIQAGCFIVVYNLANAVLFAPISAYTGYVLGRRLGKLKQTFGQWLLFNLKGLLLALLFGWLMFGAFMLIVRLYPDAWWLIAGAFFTIFMIVIVFVQPILLAPIFYKFTRLEDGELRDRLLELCRRAGVPARDVFVQHESKVTTQTNACFTGIGNTKRIVLYDNLLNTNTPGEVAVVVAHEAGHWARRHILINIALTALTALAGAFVLSVAFRSEAVRQFFGTSVERLTILPVLSLLGLVASTFASPIGAAISRAMERQADRISLNLTRDPDAFIGTHLKLARSNKSDILPHPFLVRLYAGHPTVLQRIRFAEEGRLAEQSLRQESP